MGNSAADSVSAAALCGFEGGKNNFSSGGRAKKDSTRMPYMAVFSCFFFCNYFSMFPQLYRLKMESDTPTANLLPGGFRAGRGRVCYQQ